MTLEDIKNWRALNPDRNGGHVKRVSTEFNEVQKRRIADAPVSCRGIVERAYSGEATPRGAIRAFCLQCVGYVRNDITNCTAIGCPVYSYRPYQKADEGDDEGDEQ